MKRGDYKTIREMSDKELRKFLEGCIEQGRAHWDGYYNQSPLLDWYINSWRERRKSKGTQ